MTMHSKKILTATLLTLTTLLSACSQSEETTDTQVNNPTPQSTVAAKVLPTDDSMDTISLFAGRTYDYAYTVVDTMQNQSFADLTTADEGLWDSTSLGQDGYYSGIQASYKDNGDGTITDLNTGLMWQIASSESTLNYSEALAYIDDLDLSYYDDWRLPTIKELTSLATYMVIAPDSDNEQAFLDLSFFDPINGNLWSSTFNTMDNQLDGSLYLNGTTGEIGTLESATNACYVKAVRSIDDDHVYGENNFVNNGDGTVTDLSTGLTWQSANDGIAREWSESLNYAESLQLAGYDDWRMPNAKELQSIVAYSTLENTAIDESFFSLSGDTQRFYTSTTSPLDYQDAYVISFGYVDGYSIYDSYGKGTLMALSKTKTDDDTTSTSNIYTLCVRDNLQTSVMVTSSTLQAPREEEVAPEVNEVTTPNKQEAPTTPTAPPTTEDSSSEDTTRPEPPSDAEVSGPPNDSTGNTTEEGSNESTDELTSTPDEGSAPPSDAGGPPQQQGGSSDLSSLFDDYVTSGVLTDDEAEALSTYLAENMPEEGEDPLDSAVDAGIISQDQADAIDLPQPPNTRN